MYNNDDLHHSSMNEQKIALTISNSSELEQPAEEMDCKEFGISNEQSTEENTKVVGMNEELRPNADV